MDCRDVSGTKAALSLENSNCMASDLGEYMGEKIGIIYERNVFAQHFHGHYLYKKDWKKNKNTNCYEIDLKNKIVHIDLKFDTYFHNFLFLQFEYNNFKIKTQNFSRKCVA